MKLIIDIPEDLKKMIFDNGMFDIAHSYRLAMCVKNGTPFDSVIEEYVERGAITENMIMLDKIDSIKAEIKAVAYDDFTATDGLTECWICNLDEVLEIIDKHINGNAPDISVDSIEKEEV